LLWNENGGLCPIDVRQTQCDHSDANGNPQANEDDPGLAAPQEI